MANDYLKGPISGYITDSFSPGMLGMVTLDEFKNVISYLLT